MSRFLPSHFFTAIVSNGTAVQTKTKGGCGGVDDCLAKLPSCLEGKTVAFVGNSIFRGLYFTVNTILRPNISTSYKGVHWMNRESQKLLCGKDQSWPPKPSCTSHVPGTNANTTLINTWTQQLEEVVQHLNMIFQEYSPDVVLLNVGMGHFSNQAQPVWEQHLKDTWPNLTSLIEPYFETQNPSAKLLWSPVFHFDEQKCTNKRINNSVVDLWNSRLGQHLVDWQKRKWFSWLSSQSGIVDTALGLDTGTNTTLANGDNHLLLGMDDWIHPNGAASLAMVADLARNIC